MNLKLLIVRMLEVSPDSNRQRGDYPNNRVGLPWAVRIDVLSTHY